MDYPLIEKGKVVRTVYYSELCFHCDNMQWTSVKSEGLHNMVSSGGNHAATKSNCGHFHTYDPCPVPVLNQVSSITSPPSTWGKLLGEGAASYPFTPVSMSTALIRSYKIPHTRSLSNLALLSLQLICCVAQPFPVCKSLF